MFIQIAHEDQFHLPAFDSFEEFVEELNDLLGEDTYLIENNGKKIDLTSDYQLVDDGVYKIWPKVLGGKVRYQKNVFVQGFVLFRVVSDRYYVRLVNRFSSRKIKKLAEI